MHRSWIRLDLAPAKSTVFRFLFNVWLSGVPSCVRPSGGLGGTTERRSASTWASTKFSTWSRTAAESPSPLPAAPALRARRAQSTSSTTSPLWWCIMGRASVRATTPRTATTQKEVSTEDWPEGATVQFLVPVHWDWRVASSSCVTTNRRIQSLFLVFSLQASGFTVMTLRWTCVRWRRCAALRPTSSSTHSE